MLEQTPPFLTALWLHAVFSDASRATWLGAVYVAFRCLYPFVFGATGQGGLPGVLLSTGPMYLVIAALAAPVAWQALLDLGMAL